MVFGLKRLQIALIAACCGLWAYGAQAGTTVRTIQSAGSTQIKNAAPGRDGFQPSLDKFNLQDGPQLDALARSSASVALYRNRMINRSIARSRGLGESISGEDMQAQAARLQSRLLGSFDGLTMRDERLASGGNQLPLEPPDQSLCVGNGFVVEAVNAAIRIVDTSGKALSDVAALNSFYGYAPAIDRSTGRYGPSVFDPVCYFDPQLKRFFQLASTWQTDPVTGAPNGVSSLDLAVSNSADPRDPWTIYRIPAQNDGTQGTPANTTCPCYGDYPHIGADEHGIYLTTNEYSFVSGFNSAQIYALSKRDLVKDVAKVTMVQIDTKDYLLEGNPGFTVWPAVSPRGDFSRANRGTEFFLSSLAIFNEFGTENRLRVWALSNTSSLNSNRPDLTLAESVVKVRGYGVPPSAEQKAGPTPLADCLNDTTLVTPAGVGCWNFLFDKRPRKSLTPQLLDTSDSRMQQVFYTGGRLYGALGTAVNIKGAEQAGIAYYAIRPFAQNGSVVGVVEHQGKFGLVGNNLSYPAIAALPNGRGVISFTLAGKDHFPSAAYMMLGPNGHEGPVNIAAAGKGPYDGSSGYAAYDRFTAAARWGDYGAAAVDGDDIWIASEYVAQSCSLAAYADPAAFGSCGGTRVALGNWATRISRIKP